MTPAETLAVYFRALDEWNIDAMVACCDDELEFSDEISRGWGRLSGTGEIRAYCETLRDLINEMTSELSELNERVFDHGATVTGRLRQKYLLNGEPRVYEFLVSAVFRKTDAGWRLCLGHMTPAPVVAWQS